MKRKKSDLLEPLTATVEKETKRWLKQIAKAEHRNLSQVVRIALNDYRKRRDAA